ncbi:ISL3 family transposase [Facklamia sp. P13055]|uniref:ISL3 family transposase n=1 Tax=unclassified Facklamia TaxID=2622293 RepID=UPI003D176954
MSHIISSLLGLNDKNITINDQKFSKISIKGRLSFLLTGQLIEPISHCPCCGQSAINYSIVKNGSRTSRIQLIPMAGYPTYLDLKKQRYYCKSCHSSFTAQTPEVARHCHLSNHLKRYIADQLTHTISETYIAQLVHVSIHTVRRVTNQMAQHLQFKPLHSLPQHLCFDEFKSVRTIDAAMSFIYCDAKTHRLVDLFFDRKQSSLIRYFQQFPLETRQSVQTITIDMYRPYMDLIQKVFPKAQIIIDKFHLIQALNRELNRTRIHVMNTFRNKDNRLYNKHKRYWRLIMTPRNKLHTTTYQRYRLFDWITNTSGIVDYLLASSSELKVTYEVVHHLREALQDLRIDRFEFWVNYGLTLPVSKKLKTVLRTFRRYHTFIQNTFNYSTLTNGPIEGLNNKIKVLKRNAYGYRNYSHFKNRILLMMRLYLPNQSSTSVAF